MLSSASRGAARSTWKMCKNQPSLAGPFHRASTVCQPSYFYNRAAPLSSAHRCYSLSMDSSLQNRATFTVKDDLRDYIYPLPPLDRGRCMRFSSTTTDSKKKDEETPMEPSTTEVATTATFRERMEEQRDKGRIAAQKGASTARDMIRKYGPVFMGIYGVVYVASLAGMFISIETGLMDPAYVLKSVVTAEESGVVAAATGEATATTTTTTTVAVAKSSAQVVTDILNKYPWTAPMAPSVEKNPQLANLAVAWIAVKVTEPIRLALTMSVVPRVARQFGYVNDDDDDSTEDEKKKSNNADAAASKEAPTTATSQSS